MKTNAAVERFPEGVSVSNSWFSRSAAEGAPGVHRSTAAFSPERSGGENARRQARLEAVACTPLLAGTAPLNRCLSEWRTPNKLYGCFTGSDKREGHILGDEQL